MQLFINRVNEADLGSLYVNVTNAENQQRNWFLCRLLLLFFWSLVKRLVWCSCPQPSSILRRPLHLWIMAPIHIHLNLLMYPSCGLPLWLHPPPLPPRTHFPEAQISFLPNSVQYILIMMVTQSTHLIFNILLKHHVSKIYILLLSELLINHISFLNKATLLK